MFGPVELALRCGARTFFMPTGTSQDLFLKDLVEHIQYALKSVNTPDESPLHHFVYETIMRAEEAGVRLAELSPDYGRFVRAGADRALPFLDLLISNAAGHLSPADGEDRTVMRAASTARFKREIAIARKLGVPEYELSQRIERIKQIVGSF